MLAQNTKKNRKIPPIFIKLPLTTIKILSVTYNIVQNINKIIHADLVVSKVRKNW